MKKKMKCKRCGRIISIDDGEDTESLYCLRCRGMEFEELKDDSKQTDSKD